MLLHPGSEKICRRGLNPPGRSCGGLGRREVSDMRGGVPEGLRGGARLVWLGVGSFLEVYP